MEHIANFTISVLFALIFLGLSKLHQINLTELIKSYTINPKAIHRERICGWVYKFGLFIALIAVVMTWLELYRWW